ncbi:hypothetical protein ACOMHN_009409 [Nucella lapillus]
MLTSPKKIEVSVTDREVPVVSLLGRDISKFRKHKWTATGFEKDSRKGPPAKRRKTVVAESETMTYRGDSDGPLAFPDQSRQTYVAKVNKATGQVTLSPAHFFHLQSRTKEDLQREEQLSGPITFREKADQLTNGFGSQKQQRALEQRRKNTVKEGAAARAVGSALKAVSKLDASPGPQSQETSSAIPPHNKDALTPSEVYSLTDILGLVEMEAIGPAAEAFTTCTAQMLKEWRDNAQYQISVLNRLQNLPMDGERRQKRVCLLMYLQYMIAMYNMKFDQLRKKDPLPQEWAEPVKQWMLDRFTVKTDSSKRCIPARVKDLLLSHILVGCLILDGFNTPLNPLLKDLRVSLNKYVTLPSTPSSRTSGSPSTGVEKLNMIGVEVLNMVGVEMLNIVGVEVWRC